MSVRFASIVSICFSQKDVSMSSSGVDFKNWVCINAIASFSAV
ncbi:hypothetical protein [Azospirillum melinis]